MNDWPPRFHMSPMTPPEAAKFLRQLSETTSRASQNWDNLEEIFAQFIGDAYRGGVEAAAKEVENLGGDNAQFHSEGIRTRLLPSKEQR